MKNKITAAMIFAASCATATASTWNILWVGNSDTFYFFDADTVEKNKDKKIQVWVKSVQTSKTAKDGSWATTLRWSVNCDMRTLQPLAWSTYDQDGKFIKSYANAGPESIVTPDSVGEGILKTVCEKSFPNDKSGKKYLKLENNDPIQTTKDYLIYQKSQADQAPN